LIEEGFIPVNPIDIADAGGFSVAHTNRVFQEPRQLGTPSKGATHRGRGQERLREFAAFDDRYLDLSERCPDGMCALTTRRGKL
jgi:hypothetical protein